MGQETGQESSGEMVVKANRMTQAKMPLSKVEHRIVGMLISQLEKEDSEFTLQKVYIRDLVDRSESASQDLYRRAKEICDSLIDKSIKVRGMEEGKRVYDAYNLMSRCRYKEGSGYIEAKFNEEMRPLLLQLKKRFTMYDVDHFLPLSSNHSMRIYELLKMREDLSILRITVKELRAILGVEDSYEYFSHLEHHVIKKARTEIREKTDIYFTYDVEREGRSAERIKFFIHEVGEDPPDKPKMEDRTDAPNIDVMDVFLSDLPQTQIDQLSDEALEEIHERALEQAEREVPNRSKAVRQSITLQRMKAIWAEETL